MDDLKKELNETIDDSKELLDLFVLSYKIKGARVLSKILIGLLKVFIFTNLTLIILIFASFALANFIDSFFEIKGVGFGIITLLFIIIALILWKMQKKFFEKPIVKMVINFIFGAQNREKNN